MNQLDLAIVRKHLCWSLIRVGANITAKLADEREPHELINIERHLRESLTALARMEEIE